MRLKIRQNMKQNLDSTRGLSSSISSIIAQEVWNYRQNYIHATEINGVETNEDILNQVISYDTDRIMLWNGKRCESIPTTKEEQLELQKMINEICGKDDE